MTNTLLTPSEAIAPLHPSNGATLQREQLEKTTEIGQNTHNMKKEMTYEQAITRLEEIVKKIESGEMSIDALAANIKEAKELVEICKAKLTSVEAEVRKCLDM